MGFILQVARATCFRILPENIVDLIKKDHDFLKKKKREKRNGKKHNVREQCKHLVVGTFLKRKNVYLPHINLFCLFHNKKNRTYLFKIIDPYLFALKISTLYQGHAHFIRLVTLDSQSLNN